MPTYRAIQLDRTCPSKRKTLHAAVIAASLFTTTAMAQGTAQEVVITGTSRTFSTAETTASMEEQQTSLTSVLATVDNLPGVNITEGDTFGFDDWSTTINLRGYQSNLDEQQVGITIDGLPNGDSSYGGGTKANRYIDSANSGGVEVNQGTSDISSRSLEALGGTLNFMTADPVAEERMRVQAVTGDFEAQRYYARYDSGYILDNSTRLWISGAHNEATDWIEGSAQNERDHFAGKLISELEGVTLTGYISYDDAHENNYQRITRAEFDANPESDRLMGTWTDIPYVNQVYRQGWATLRENLFYYLKADFELNNDMSLNVAGYSHDMEGRGDWIPPEIVDVIDDGAGNGNSELITGTTAFGGAPMGTIQFVDAGGNALSPTPGCESSITSPYGGAGPEYDPACYPANAIPVQSYRHTHYQRERKGFTADFTWDTMLSSTVGNQFRAGLWYEDSTREEYRDWHKLSDARIGIDFERPAYWRQYDLEFPRETLNYYLSDTIDLSFMTFSLGLRKFDVESEARDRFGVLPTRSVTSDTDTLFSTGVTLRTPVEGLEAFAGYSENTKPLTDVVLQTATTSLDGLDPETAENMELGLRYTGDRLAGSAVYFSNEFDNRLEFLSSQLAGNIPDYLIGTDGRYDNVGGIESSGLELALSAPLSENWSLYGSYTYTDATYLGTGLGAAADAALGLVPGNTVTGTPESMWVLSLDWTRNNYNAGISTKYVDERYIDRSNTSVADAYTVTDLYVNINVDGMGSDLLQGLQMGLVINNITDESYLGGISGFGAWIGAPRTASFTITADF